MKFEIKKEDTKAVLKCIRFPGNLENKIQEEAQKNNVTFSKFVIEACRFALNNMNNKS